MDAELAVAGIAAAIGEPARLRMLHCLLDGHARTATELAVVAQVSPSTASAHLRRLESAALITLFVQGKHRFYSLAGPEVASVLEGLQVLAGAPREGFVSRAPGRLRAARVCYDHLAGALGVRLHDRLMELKWITKGSAEDGKSYEVTVAGAAGLEAHGLDVAAALARRRRFAYACLDWSERRPHLGGALGAALLALALRKRWVTQDLDSRSLEQRGSDFTLRFKSPRLHR